MTIKVDTGRQFILVMLLLFTSIPSIGQEKGDEDLSQYFDDEGISQAKGILKTDAIAMIHGDWPVLYEHMLSDQFSIEGGVGILMPYYVHDFLTLIFTENNGITNNQLGFSLKGQLKLYTDKAPDLHYWGVQLYHRSFSDLGVTEFTFTKGLQRFVGKRLTIDYGLGLGLRTQQIRGDQTIFDPAFSFLPIVPLFFKIGFLSTDRE